MDEIRDRLELLESNLPQRIEAGGIFRRSKLPFRTDFQCREVLAWRCAELAREAYEALKRDRFVTAILLTRAVIETVAAQWYLSEKLRIALDTGNLETFNSSF